MAALGWQSMPALAELAGTGKPLELHRIFSSTCRLQFVRVFTENLVWKVTRFGSRWQEHRVTETGAQWHRGAEAQSTIAHTWRHTESENSLEPECTVRLCLFVSTD